MFCGVYELVPLRFARPLRSVSPPDGTGPLSATSAVPDAGSVVLESGDDRPGRIHVIQDDVAFAECAVKS